MTTSTHFMRVQSHSKLSIKEQKFCSWNTLTCSRSNISGWIFEKGAKLGVFLDSPEHLRDANLILLTRHNSHMAIVPIITAVKIRWTSACVCYGFICRWSVLGAFSIFGHRCGRIWVVVVPWRRPTAGLCKNDWNDPREEFDDPCMDGVLGGQVRFVSHLLVMETMMGNAMIWMQR